ncbi:MAG: hypothetical protein IH830_13470 [Planctomycetes bacterium]|nr:hypothetical protein [Planctomycetota bacterium]
MVRRKRTGKYRSGLLPRLGIERTGRDMLPHQNMPSNLRLLAWVAAEAWRIALDDQPRKSLVRVAPDRGYPAWCNLPYT